MTLSVLRIVNSFKNRQGDFINYILDCPMKYRQFKGGPNIGKYYSSPSDCAFCKHKVSHKWVTYYIGENELDAPYYESVVCSG